MQVRIWPSLSIILLEGGVRVVKLRRGSGHTPVVGQEFRIEEEGRFAGRIWPSLGIILLEGGVETRVPSVRDLE